MRAMEQLPAYLDRVASGGRDVPLALLPHQNDLRAVRGGALLSEGTLLMLNLHSDEPARPIATGPAGETSELAKRLRPRFQRALLGWIRGDNVEQQLGAMSEIAEQFETASASQPVFQLWWVVGSILEGLRQRGLDGSVSIKRLLGQVDRELRRLQDTGEERYSQQPPLELLNNLLFYVARVTTQGPRVTGVRRSFQLDELLPVDERIDEARETLSAPSVRLMRTVAAAIRAVPAERAAHSGLGDGAAQRLARHRLELRRRLEQCRLHARPGAGRQGGDLLPACLPVNGGTGPQRPDFQAPDRGCRPWVLQGCIYLCG
jgi:chemosensory pili system protein ChpA (sensor histidine kinase/response regulator)